LSRPAVAIVCTYYAPLIGGSETAARQLAQFLARQDRRVTVITKRLDANQHDRETLDGAEVIRIGRVGAPRGSAKWVNLPAFVRALVRERARYDAVVCVDYRAVGIAALMARGRTGRPVVFHAQTDGVISGARVRTALADAGFRGPRLADLATWPIRWAYRGADAYCCISRSIERDTIQAGVAADRVHYSPNPVDTTLFRPALPDERAALRARVGVDPSSTVAIYAGRLSREKGLLDLIDAWCRGMPAGSELIVAGAEIPDHPWNVAPDARARAATASRPVRFIGGLAQGALAEWLRLADVQVQPSHFEAFGTSAIEAMASGLPVIASDVGGLPDFVTPNVNGLLVPVQDPASLASALARLLGNSTERARLAAGARATAPAFDIELVLGRFAEVIDAVATRP
jgi:glycosyltransferase involved in cell wall biosynthesis